MARKKHLINVHTSTGTTAPTGASLYLGEIAVQHTSGSPALWVKMGASESSTDYEKFIGETEINNEFKKTNHNIPYVVQSGDTYTGSTSQYKAEAPELTGLTEGQSIIFHPKQNSTSGNTDFPSACTLDVQLADGTMTGPKMLYVRGNTKVLTHITGCTDIKLTYHEDTTWSGVTGLSGWWVDFYYDTDKNTDVRAHNLYYGNTQRTITGNTLGRYRLMLSSADNEHWVPINTATATSATAAKTITSVPINPFGPIAYYSATGTVTTDSSPGASSTNTKVSAFTIGYSYVVTLTEKLPVYLKCTPQSDGSAIIDSTTPFVQSLPTTEDGKIYIFLGVATSTGTCELYETHPVYEYKNGHVREYQEGQEIEMILGSAYTYTGISYVNSSTTIADAYSALTKELIDDEYVMSETMNFLNDKIDELSAETISEIQAISGDVLTISGIIEDNELVVAGALNELNSRVSELSASTASMGEGGILGSGYTYSGLSYVNSATTIADAYSAITSIVLDNEEVVSAALNVLYDDITAVSGYVGELEQYLAENEELIAAGFNNLDYRVGTLETHMNGDYIWLTSYDMGLVSGETPSDFELDESDTVNEAFAKLENRVGNDEEVTAAAINDLNDRLIDLEENGSSAGEEELLALSASVVTNVNQLSTLNTDFNSHSSNTTVHITSSERTRWNNAWTSGVSAYTKVLQLSAATTAHTANTTMHITSAERTRWNTAWTSGVSAYTKVLQLSAATTAMNSTLTTVSGAAHNKIAELSAATTAHTANTSAHLASGDRERWDAGWTSGVSAYTLASSFGDAIDSLSAKLITDEYVLASSLNDINNKVLTHSADTSVHIPVVDSGDNGKILRVVNGQWALVNPVAIYTGNTSPQSSQGIDGDIYLQF